MAEKLLRLDESGKVFSIRGQEIKPDDHVIRVLTNEELPAQETHSSWTLTSAYRFADKMSEGLGVAIDEAEPKK